MLHVLIILVVSDVKCQCRENHFRFHYEQKYTCLEYSLCYNDGQCQADGEHYYCECSSNFIGISQQQNKIIRVCLWFCFLLSKIQIVNFQQVNQYHVEIMDHVGRIINEQFHAIVLEHIDENILSFE